MDDQDAAVPAPRNRQAAARVQMRGIRRAADVRHDRSHRPGDRGSKRVRRPAMSEWDVVKRCCAASIVLSAVLSSGPLAAQNVAGSTAEQSWVQPRTPWGDPNLQGVYRYEAAIPLERPA